ncbi:MAG: cobalamin biosynthesis protein CbiD [Bacteroidaceae bacterium]|nr:cobalamin biosynthesis protein CbiD [Bacteroidaceae bacterium]
MILVFGGTTEGRQAIKALEAAGQPYFYSTKTGEQEVVLHHGVRTDGAMDADEMARFCRKNDIRLIVDAAHPFASRLHQTIGDVAASLRLPVVRFERIYPPRQTDITWIDDYREVPTDVSTLLATTGVQSIRQLQWLEKRGVKVVYRILNRESSIALARNQGARDEQLCYYEEPADMPSGADALLLKESGLTGGFVEKVEEARRRGMRIIALRRPPMPESFVTVDGEHGLRRMVERLLPEFFPLKSGLTTGTCATAAAVAATVRLTKGETPAEVPIRLPNGETINVAVGYGEDYAYCIKESGDDPDVTNGIEIRAQAERANNFEIRSGSGIGRFTLPGFDFPPGEPAINRIPREMLRNNIRERVRITLSVPNGEEIAHRTFNPRLGIEGGISIIGVSGIVMPYSEEAFIQSIRKCMEVARASQSPRIVIGSGMKSEQQLRHLYPDLPSQAFVEYGNYIGETLKIADEMGINRMTLGIMIGKAVKLAQGHLDTHSRRVTMDRTFVAQLLREADCSTAAIAHIDGITIARELWDILSPSEAARFSEVVVRHCYRHCKPLLPKGELTILLLDDKGGIYGKK